MAANATNKTINPTVSETIQKEALDLINSTIKQE